METIYLDHNATTPLLPEVADAMAACHAAGYANPASQHRPGRRARQALEDAREGIAAILGADLTSAQPDSLIFTSGGTEANNLALFGLAGESPRRVIISAIEHPSIAEAAKELGRRGWLVETLPVTSDGVIDLQAAECVIQQLSLVAPLHSNPKSEIRNPKYSTLVSVMLGNNETGAVQPVARLAELCRAVGALLHTDAVQAIGKSPVHFRQLGVDAMSLAAHKLHGPRGIGALVLRHGVQPKPQLLGGFQQTGLRAGTEDVALAVGMHAALCAWQREAAQRHARLRELRDRLEAALRADWPGLIVHAEKSPRLPHTSAVAFPGLNRQALVMALDLAGVACSTGSACASGSSDPSPTLVAMGCAAEVLQSSLRFSVGATTTLAEVDEACRRILCVCKDLKSANSRR